MPSKSEKKREEDYRAEDDLRTLSRAEEIRADQTRMSACRRIQRKQVTALQRVGRAITDRSNHGNRNTRSASRTTRTTRTARR